jgi:hypothetical protein
MQKKIKLVKDEYGDWMTQGGYPVVYREEADYFFHIPKNIKEIWLCASTKANKNSLLISSIRPWTIGVTGDSGRVYEGSCFIRMNNFLEQFPNNEAYCWVEYEV